MSIERNFHKYLVDLVRSDLPNSKAAKIIAQNYQTLKYQAKDKLLESIVPLYQAYSEGQFDQIQFRTAGPLQVISGSNDFRLKCITLSNVRGIPASKGNIKFGIDLMESGQIQNAILFGPNGSGKSTLFDSIEYIYTSKVSEKNLRSADPAKNKVNDYIDYLGHFNHPPECEIDTPAGQYSFRKHMFNDDSALRTIFPENHFISDYDIYRKGQVDYTAGNETSTSFHTLLANSLGLQEYLDFNNLLSSLATYRRAKESRRQAELQNQLKEVQEELLVASNSIEQKRQQVTSIRSGVRTGERDVKRQKSILLSELTRNSFKPVFDKDRYLNLIVRYRTALEAFVGLSVNIALQNEAQFLTLGLEQMNHVEGCPFCENSKSTIGEIKSRVDQRLSDLMVFQQSRSAIESIVKEFVNQIQELSNIIDLSINSARIDIKTLINIPELNSILSREEELLRFLETIRVTVSDLTEALAQNEGRPATPAISVTNFEKAFKQYEALLRVDLPNIPTVLNTFGKDREEQIKIVENSLLARSEGLSTSEQAVIMESDIRNLQATVTRLKDRSSSLSKELEGVNRVIEIHNSIKSEAGELSRLLEVKVNAILASTFETIREPIVNILSDYLDGESIELHIDIESTENPDDPDLANRIITAKVSSVDKDTGEVILVSPNKYFNTFRYRLFCMMVTLGIAITARKDSKINLPLVLDDIFYASDYGSKTSFKKFLIKVFSIFKKFNSDMPLQFILFTHDELILDGALEAMSEYSDEMVTANEPIPATDDVAEEWKAPISERTIVARLFPAEEADHSPRTCTLGTFWDLIYKIPHPIQVQLLNEI